MPKFKPYNQNQSMLLPPDLRSWLPKDHAAILINDVVEGMDLRCVENTYSEEGAPAYNPKGMLKVLFYAYTKGIRSSRQIELLTKENVPCRYLSGNTQPDHGTINLFRQIHLDKFEDLFAQIVLLCDGLGMVDLQDLSIDSCVVKANASKKRLYTKEELAKLKTKIRGILEEAQRIDEEEDKKYGKKRGYSQLPDHLLDPKARKEAIEKELRKLKQVEEAEMAIEEKQAQAKTIKEKNLLKNKTISMTDQDSNLMKLKNGKMFKSAYLGQVATSNQVIVAYDVDADTPDAHMLIPMVDKAEAVTGKKVIKTKADSAYFSKANMKAIKERGIDAYIPDPKKAKEEREERNETIPSDDRRCFQYRKELDEYTCPHGTQLKFIRIDKGNRVYGGANCSRCTRKTIHVDFELEAEKEEMRKKLNTKDGKRIYLERMYDVEPVFGNILYNQKAAQFLCRGKPIVNREFGLSAVSHNLVKILKWIKKNKKSAQDMHFGKLLATA